MRDVRTQLDAAKASYRSAKYPGDLSDELLPAPPRQSWYLAVQPWLMPIAGGAIAAMVILAVWKPSLNSGGGKPVTPILKPTPVEVSVTRPQAFTQTVESIRSVPVETYVMDVRTAVQQAVDKMAVDVDGTFDSKLVADTTQTARQVAGEVRQVAKDIGSQLFPRPQ